MHSFQVNGERSPRHYFLRDKRIINWKKKKKNDGDMNWTRMVCLYWEIGRERGRESRIEYIWLKINLLSINFSLLSSTLPSSPSIQTDLKSSGKKSEFMKVIQCLMRKTCQNSGDQTSALGIQWWKLLQHFNSTYVCPPKKKKKKKIPICGTGITHVQDIQKVWIFMFIQKINKYI